jgi:hypothetical protein
MSSELVARYAAETWLCLAKSACQAGLPKLFHWENLNPNVTNARLVKGDIYFSDSYQHYTQVINQFNLQ